MIGYFSCFFQVGKVVKKSNDAGLNTGYFSRVLKDIVKFRGKTLIIKTFLF